MDVQIRLADSASGERLFLPSYGSAQAAGADLRAAVNETLTLEPGERCLIPTGFHMALPQGFEGQVRGRSGLALRHGLYIPNAPGTIDADYRGEVGVILQNGGQDPVRIERGERIAQLVFAPVQQGRFVLCDQLGETPRGAGGFGSTGRR
ncbi:MAG: dUTP diphosphatase [Myxococcales bacterium]|nr:dUTP diphosphatase [Myxococcales bacterium]